MTAVPEHVEHDAVVDLLRREITPKLYDEIRELWKRHSIAEDNRDLPGLMSTLTDDCLYELAQSEHRWEGHAGATQFYLQLLTAFPDIHFDLTDIVIGPQGVCEEARVTGTFESEWLANTMMRLRPRKSSTRAAARSVKRRSPVPKPSSISMIPGSIAVMIAKPSRMVIPVE